MATATALELAGRAYDRLHRIAARVVAEGQEHPDVIVTVIEQEDRPLALIPSHLFDTRTMTKLSKDRIAEKHERLARLADGCAVVLIMECWMIDETIVPDQKQRDAIATANANGQLRLRDVPGRREGIAFSIRVGQRQYFGRGIIDRAAKTLDKAELLDLQNLPEGHSMEGRFIGSAIERGADA